MTEKKRASGRAAVKPRFYTAGNFSLREERPNDRLHLNVVPFRQPAYPGLHTHDFFEMVYIEHGTGIHTNGRRQDPIFSGDCFIIPPWEPHGFVKADDLSIINVIFYPEIFKRFDDWLLETPGFLPFFSIEPLFRHETSFRHKLHLDISQQRRFLGFVHELRAELSEKAVGFETACIGLFIQVVILLSRCFDRALESSDSNREFAGKRDAVDTAISYLEQNFNKDIRLRDVARSSFISPSRLCHVFKEVTGTPLFDYLARMRVDRARDLLHTSHNDVAGISYALGFHNPAYFTRVFKKFTGRTPSEFRRKAK